MRSKLASFLLAVVSLSPVFAVDPIRPDRKLTPGDVVSLPVETIIQRGYANVIDGGARHVTEATKRQVFIAYFGKVPAHPGDYEVDHLISLELGGSNDAKNLWPESYGSKWNARVKDKVEDRMAFLVRQELKAKGHDAAMALLTKFQREISRDWIAAMKKYCPESLPK